MYRYLEEYSEELVIFGFSFFSVYLLSFLFEGYVLYSVLGNNGIEASPYIFVAIFSVFIGLFFAGAIACSAAKAKMVFLWGIGLCFLTTIPFFFMPSILWNLALVFAGFGAGLTVASWGYCLKFFTKKDRRLHTCADVLIYSNLLMTIVNVVAGKSSALVGMALIMCFLFASAIIIYAVPIDFKIAQRKEQKNKAEIKGPLMFLFIFVFIITINSGFMYEVFNPAFSHLLDLAIWYWAVPYIVAIALVRHFLSEARRSKILYIGMFMLAMAFIAFMLLGRSTLDYFIINTLMLGACGIFDLFWWSILGEILNYSENPAKVFGIGLSANVLGIFLGGLLGVFMRVAAFTGIEVAVIALFVISVTLAILPFLNQHLVRLLKNHTYLHMYEDLDSENENRVMELISDMSDLTKREKQILGLILAGKTNLEIAGELSIQESTVKTHVRNILTKYCVSNRTQLISIFLKDRM